MTNLLVVGGQSIPLACPAAAATGDVYAKIIQDVIRDSKTEFEENGVSQTTLGELEKEWKARLSAREVARMPWDPKPAPPQPVQQQAPNPVASLPSVATSGLPPSYPQYHHPAPINNAARVKAEPNSQPQYHGLPSAGYPQSVPASQGGEARAAQLAQQYAQSRGLAGGLALPGQRPPGMQQSGQAQQQAQQMYMQQQRQQQQQQALQQQQNQPRIKVENNSPQLHQGSFQQQPRPPNPAYAQTDGADEGREEWQAYIANRRAASAQENQRADHIMRNAVMQGAADLQSGLMMTLDEQPKGARSTNKKRRSQAPTPSDSAAVAGPSVPQLDGDFDDDEKPVKDEDDADAINSDLDSDEDPTGDLDEDDDDFGDSILCTYDKVQRVKNKWKCILKDGVMSINKKEWVFLKGTGEFEW
ncbi:transcription factor IIA subunit alpha [Friedmanniomyces endolithicus]|nr:transcription factor IIA subunit alpha [Friedmanniomyces endolithicus]KAK0864560.1 transcription factor IIA subunit alpha [Friedmanniomyces endolithicus]KAK0871199.1 transcription factor IIA subunit alpha [Friedmanniomyces endolithicus]KAK0893653.1 transcription factor IIA subunit alpha [Friedmanniomyces endolithicus]